METLVKKYQQETKENRKLQLQSILNDCQFDIEDELVGVDYDKGDIYLYAFIYFDDYNNSDVGYMVDGETIELSKKEKDLILNTLLHKAGVKTYGEYCVDMLSNMFKNLMK